jgi:iron complex outermembrane receptor protein
LSYFLRASCALSALVLGDLSTAFAQSATQLPTITVTDNANRDGEAAPSSSGASVIVTPGGSLTIPTVVQASRQIQRAPGAVAVVPADAWKDTKATTVKDMLGYVPGVWAQPKWGEDSRLSIRGSGLSRNFHGRSLQLYMDGIPINTADGYFDLQEIDPTAYRYVEVFRGANALRFGANSLGGAINFVVPSGRDANLVAASADRGSFDFRRMQASSGATYGPFDYFVTGSWQSEDGFRDHSNGNLMRGSGNVGYQFSPNVETRFYFNGNTIEQRIPGAVTKSSALNTPKKAAAINATNDYQRNINSNRVANKTTFRTDTAIFEIGLFNTNRHLMHPIFQWIDQTVDGYGGFGRMVDERNLWGFKNRLVAGVNIHNGDNDSLRFGNGPGAVKGALAYSALEKSRNTSAYAENSFYILPAVAVVAGTQFLSATRERLARFGTTSGRTDFDLWSPKFGLLWDIDPTAQVFANVSRSAEVPSFGEGSMFFNVPFTSIKAQRATTYEIGTRGQRPDYTWDFALYRAQIRNELQCFSNPAMTGACDVLNADRTVHQGIEAGFGAAVMRSLFVNGNDTDRLWINVAYTLNDFYYDDDARWGNNTLPGAPRHYFRGEILYKHPSGFYIGPNVEWVPEGYFVDAANTFMTDPYAIWGMKAGYDSERGFSFYVEARNLSDRAYISSASIAQTANTSSALFEPGTGRAVYAGAKFKW